MKNNTQENSSSFAFQSFESQKLSARQTAQPNGEKFLVFYIDEKLYGVSSKNVAEATASFAVTVLPNSPEWLLGLGNLRGEIVSVINLPKLLQKQTTPYQRKHKFIVLRSQVFEPNVAFKVDRISEILTIAPETVELNSDENFPFFLGKTLHKNQPLTLFDSESLLSMLTVG